MAELVELQDRMLGRLARSQKPLAIVGTLLALLGATYVTWGVLRFDPRADPRVEPGFDWPVARLAFLFDRGQARLEQAEPGSPVEQSLRRVLSRNMHFSTGVMVMLLRIFLGTLVLVLGFAILTVVVERARLIAMIRHLRE
ncbi:MAG: hypothetical protein WEF50_06485 [Myxococcota bacterium]